MAIDEKKLIDKEKLLRELGFVCAFLPCGIKSTEDELRKWIEKQPEISLETKTSDWIPCSERLPEENGSYIVTSLDYVDTFEAIFDEGEWYSVYCCYDIKNVIAWMPMPEPYKGKKNE